MTGVVVLGGAGFIGSHLIESLLALEYEVHCVDDFSTGKMSNLNQSSGNPRFSLTKGSILDEDVLRETFRDADVVFLHAAILGVRRVEEDPVSVIKANALGVQNVLEAARLSDVDKVLFASSSEVYGISPEMPLKEDSQICPMGPYARAKLLGEELCSAYSRQYGMWTVSLRYFNCYGPRQDSSPYGFVIAIFADMIAENRPLPVFGDGSQTRDFTFVSDTVAGTISAMLKSRGMGEPLNIGSGLETSILELASTMISIHGTDVGIEYLPPRGDEIPRRCADVSRSSDAIGYRPEINIEEGLRATIEWYRSIRK